MKTAIRLAGIVILSGSLYGVARAESTAGGEAFRQSQNQAPGVNQWRYRWHHGTWWYWTPRSNWVYWLGNRWVPYDPNVNLSGNQRIPAYGARPASSRYYSQTGPHGGPAVDLNPFAPGAPGTFIGGAPPGWRRTHPAGVPPAATDRT